MRSDAFEQRLQVAEQSLDGISRKAPAVIKCLQTEFCRGNGDNGERVVGPIERAHIAEAQTQVLFECSSIERVIFKNQQALEERPPTSDCTPTLHLDQRAVFVFT